ncbi:MAG TPA: DUF1631 family protein [Burkholderiales bacterium]|nr:DUF1631 family protein [Burkholderiales bacterium]
MGTPARPAAPAGNTGSRPATESKALLSQCRDLARSKLSRIVAEALDKVENDLFAAAEASTSRAEQQVLFEAMSQVKLHRADIATSFDRFFIEIYDRRTAATRGAGVPSAAPTLGELTLVDDAAMEEDLIVNDLARKTRNRIDPEQLLGIRARFGHLLSSEQVEDDTANPLCPEAVFEALKMACGKLPGDFAVKRSLLNAFQPYVAAGITTVYADVNQNLISHHVLPRIRHQVKRAADIGVASTNPALAASQAMNLAQLMGGAQGAAAMTQSQLMNLGQNALAMSGALDLSALLAGVMNGGAARAQVTRMLADPSRYAMEATLTSTPASPALMTSLSALQSAAMPAEGGAFDFMSALGDQVRAQSNPLDQLTIELVTMVFDYILDDKNVPETVKGEISRLQIVAVKAAILDRTFFARRQHPMRQLLDRVAEVAADPDIATEEGTRFILELRAMVDYIVHQFTDDLAIFTAALDTLEQMVEENRETRQQELAPTTSELARKEEAEIAHATALAEIKRRVTRKTPAFVRDFLYQWWTKTLVDAYMKEREGDDSWTHRLGVVDALVWSVSPLRTGEIQQLASMLPTLMRSLLRGMNAIEMAADARHGLFNQLMQAHTASINAAKAQSKGQTVPTAADVARIEDAPVSEPLPPEEPAEAPPETDDYHVHTAMALERGAVIEFMDGAAAVRAKLSWVSPKQTILLFTSSAGGARKLAPKAFAELLRQQKARVIEVSEALMDRVVHAMMGPESVPAAA